MADQRERLIKLLGDVQYLGGLEEKVADHLITNGVIVPPVKIVDVVWGMFYDSNWDRETHYIEACHIEEIYYYHSSGSFVFGVIGITTKQRHNINYENMYFTLEEAEAALERSYSNG